MNTTTCISILRSCMLNVLTIPLKGRISPLTVNLCMPTVPLELYAPILWRIQLATLAHTRSQTFFSFLVGTRLAKTSPRYFPKTIFEYCKHEWVRLALMFVANQYIAQLMHYYWFPFQSKTIRDLLSVPNHSFTWLRAEPFITSTAIEIFLRGFLSD